MSTIAVTPQTTIQLQPYQGQLVKMITYQTSNLTMLPNGDFELFDDTENGQLLGFEVACDNPNILFNVVTYADNITLPNYVNNFTMTQLLQLGRGLTPGHVEVQPNGQSQDIMGTPSNIYPYLARFKPDTIADATGSTTPAFVLRFEPTVYVQFKRIVAVLSNTDVQNTATIANLDIKRMVYVQSDTPPLTDPNIGLSTMKRTIAVPTKGVPNYSFPKQSQDQQLEYDEQSS